MDMISGLNLPMRRVLDRLQNVKRHDGYYTALCPAHDDHSASLSISEGEHGRVLAKCHAGCSFEDIARALELKASDFFTNNEPIHITRGDSAKGEGGAFPPSPSPQRCNADVDNVAIGCALADYGVLKALPVEFLRGLGLSEITYSGLPAVRIPYMNASGTITAVRFRTALTKGEHGDDRFRWKSGAKPSLYGLWRLGTPESVVLVEGESDCHTLWFHGIPALGIPGAANWNEARDAPHLDTIPVIYIVIEPDAGGQAMKKWLAASRIRDRVRLVSLDAITGGNRDA